MTETVEDPNVYPGPSRGEFLVARLLTADGLFQEANCRIRKVSVMNYAGKFAYAIVGYQIEYWPQGAKAPYEEGGEPAALYRPKDRPDFTTFYLRIKVSSTLKILYLEDAIINDFITSKSLLNPIFLNPYLTEAQDQINSAAIERQVIGTDFLYSDAVHTTRYESSATDPLVVTEQWMSYRAHPVGEATNPEPRYIKNKPFVSLKDMIDTLVADFTAPASVPTE